MLGMADWNAGAFFTALAAIIVIDLVLAGDNAIVIAMAARSLPDHLRRKAILWGTAGAVVMRVLMTIGVVWLLKIPGLLLVGGAALLWIAYRLLTQSDSGEAHGIKATTMAAALKTIIIADTVMGIDNVLGVAGAAKGSMALVIIGLLISVPIMVWGSTLALKLIERFPLTIFIGAAILVYTAMHMIVTEPVLRPFWDSLPGLNYAAYVLGFVVVLGGGWLVSKRRESAKAAG
ncbi:YjbE family putative metal transport protein [Collimonas pratensis]|uniref:Integral membrane, YjbE family protein n=2 Tax=Collimonas pratensis TaxID=279113 RepID=A0A127QWP1_9BURK|nr:TerC family protein [Collimonas pratensis]AMP05490.1 integral membrane, YjbE family protein [Collimonas pratensis]AMP14483.1 integral membrane, YjbE family protein [Collimonas pratensis]NKI69151.1 YjbE family putative metal transport protein [Collimonas pratensis]